MLGLEIFEIVIMLVGTLLVIVWIVFFLKGAQYRSMFSVLSEKEFPLKDIYGTGYAFLYSIGYKYKSKGDRKLRQELNVLYGEKYAEYYLHVTHAQQVTFTMTLFVLSFIFYGLARDLMIMFVFFMFSGLAYYYYGTQASKRIQARSDELLHDFADVVSKLALLTNAGMILREAWERVAFGGEGVFYDEMQIAVEEIRNGVAEVDAIYNFGRRCVIPEVKKFTSTIIQGMTKGSRDLTLALQEQSHEVWQLKKQLVRREGERAAAKLLIPISVMFIGILILVIVPILSNLGA